MAIAAGKLVRPARPLRRWLWLAVLLAAISIAAVATVPFGLTHVYMLRQDIFVIAALVLMLLACGLSSPADVSALPVLAMNSRRLAAIAVALALLLWFGSYALFGNYPMSRDEHMAVFDAAVFRQGHLATPLAPFWRPFVTALIPEFILPISGNVAWVSAYLPVNAMARAVFGQIADPALMNPILFGVGLIALYDVCKRLFPEDQGTQGAAVLIYCTSAQGLAAAMTSYAMTAHLALNLCWLSCFLRNTRKSHAGAMALGFVGIGIHQVIFHPLFALPFLDRLRREGRWRLLSVYVGTYAVFGLMWVAYPYVVAHSVASGAASQVANADGLSLPQRTVALLMNHNPATLWLMAANLMRFFAWQNLALLPALVLAWPAIRRDEGLTRPLVAGIVLTLAAMTILLPYQGHGWGYRYVHGCLGSFALLGAYGWQAAGKQADGRRILKIGTVATLCWSLPFLGWQAHKFIAPYVRANKALTGIGPDMVILETDGLGFPLDLIRNGPDLTNRPILLASTELNAQSVLSLCSHGSVAFVNVSELSAMGVGSAETRPSRKFRQLEASARAGCPPRGPA